MTAPDAILTVTALALLLGGFVTGVFMSVIRAEEPATPKYLSLAHQGSFMQAALLLGVAFALGFSTMSEAYDTITALVASAAALLLFSKDVVNWRLGVEDEFRHRGLGYKMAVAFGPVHLIGLVMLTVAVLSGF